jgi:hypothetical protein
VTDERRPVRQVLIPGFAAFGMLTGPTATTREPVAPAYSMFRIAALMAVLGGTLATGPAQAQLGAIFGDSPPRPPADVPNGSFPPQPPPVQYQRQLVPPPPPGPTAPSAIQSQPLPPPPGATMANPAAPNSAMAPQMPPPHAQGPGLAPTPANAAPQQPADTAPQSDETVVTETPTQKIDNARSVFSGLDKITGRIISFDEAIGETVQFGALRVTTRACYTRPPTEATNTDAFVEVDEVTLQGEIKRIFTGWMFAASPGLHAVEHPIYDVWLTDCASPIKVAEPAVAPAPATAPGARAPASSRSRQGAPPRQQGGPPVAPAPPGTQAQPR